MSQTAFKVTKEDELSITANLRVAVLESNIKKVRKLTFEYPETDISFCGGILLLYAIKQYNHEMVQFLLNKGIRPNFVVVFTVTELLSGNSEFNYVLDYIEKIKG